MIKNLFIEINNVKIKIATNKEKYYKYLKNYFRGVSINAINERNININVDIFWEANKWMDYYKGIKQLKNISLIGSNELVCKNRVVTIKKVGKRKKMICDVKKEDNKLILKHVFLEKKFKDFLKNILKRKQQENDFFNITYSCVYYPLIWYLEYFKDIYVLHASAINVCSNGIIICGLEGIGKTSLALSLLKENNAKFLSDNLIFYNKKNVFSCYELVRINKGEKNCLWKNNFKQINELQMRKDLYMAKDNIISNKIIPKIVIFPEFSSEFSIEKLSMEKAVNRAMISTFLPGELNRYFEYKAFYGLLDLDINMWKNQYKVLLELFSTLDCYKIKMRKKDGIEDNYLKIYREIFDKK